jgi:hypothetical protein
MSSPAANSRYLGLATAVFTFEDGREVVYLKRRFLPPPESLALIGTCTLMPGDRLDNLAARWFGDAELSWRIGDGNRELRPAALTETPGRVLRITQPAGMPGVPDA